jgi:hypothetical protein
MLFTSKDYVFKQMQENQLAFYEVLDENVTVEKAVEQLRECLESLNGSFVTIKVSAVTKKAKAQARDYSLRIYNVKLSTPAQQVGGIGAVNDDYKSLMAEITALKEQLIETKFKNEIAGLREEMERIKTEKSDPISDIAQAMLIQYMQPQQKGIVGIAGTSESVSATEIQSDRDRFTAVVKRLRNIDPDFVTTLEKLAAFAETNPDKYKLYLNMI